MYFPIATSVMSFRLPFPYSIKKKKKKEDNPLLKLKS